MTFEKICEKPGFNPMDGYDYKFSGHEDDTQVSPFAVLSLEESNFLYDYLVEYRSKMKTEPKQKAP